MTTQQTKKLAGKVALVTGGSRGIGAAAARALAEEGAQVAISYNASPARAQQVVAELEQRGVRAEAFQADQADAAQVARLVKAVVERFGRLDILVNNAGVFLTGGVGDAQSHAEVVTRQTAVNVGGVVAAVRAAAPLLGEGGRIINIGSVLGSRVPFPGLADYSASKAAVAIYTRGWARDLGARGITVNNVAPGPIDTEMNPDGSEFSTVLKASTALGRYGKAEEVAAAVAFLAGPGASYITGATLEVDGGANA